MKCKGVKDKSECFNCPYADCLTDIYGNIPSEEDQIKTILSLKRHNVDQNYYYNHQDEILEKRKTEEYKAKGREASRKYRRKHKEEVAEQRKRYRDTHRDKVRELKRNYYARHREQERERNRRYYEEHKEEIKAKRKCASMKKNMAV